MDSFRIFKYLMLIIVFLSLITPSISKNGDTTNLRTIEYTTPREGWFDFPSNDNKYHRIVANYKLICPQGKPCGEWDYIANLFVVHFFAPNYRYKSKSPETASFVLDTAFTYKSEKIDGNWTIVKTPIAPVTIYFYNIDDSQNPTKPIDSLQAWELYYTDYKIDENGKFTDSTLVNADTTFTLNKKRVYFRDNVTVQIQHEIFRYITPYGNNLKLNDGWMFRYDVTDLQELLSGKVFLYAPCGGWGDQTRQDVMESLELTFDFIEGTPVRDIKSLTKLWQNGGAVYDAKFDSRIPEYKISLINDEKTARLKMINTGHGFGGNSDNCSEFCKKKSYIALNNTNIYEKYIWRECGDIPMYPQGGTWLADRTNWCPGMEVPFHDFELTEHLIAGENLLDYDMEYYDKPYSGSGNVTPFWVITGYLIKYSDYNFQNDAGIIEIITPSNDSIQKRFNPSSFNSIITFRNTGKNIIKSIKFEYGFVGMDKHSYVWEGDLISSKDTTITLPFDDYKLMDSDNEFNINIVEVNGKTDDYQENNFGKSIAKFPKKFHKGIIINLSTNNYNDLNAASPYQLYLVNSKNEVVFKRETTQNNTNYKDSINLESGAYTLILYNPYGYGLGYWVLGQNYGLRNGSLSLYSGDKLMQNFNPDFGNSINYNFVVSEMPVVKTNLIDNKYDFGDVALDSSKTFTIELSPDNANPINIKSIQLKDGDNKKFEILSIKPTATNNEWTLNQGEKIEIEVKYTALLKGKRFANIDVVSNDFYLPTRQIRLEGRGFDPASAEDNFIHFDAKLIADVNFNNATLVINSENTFSSNYEVSIFNSIGQKVATVYNGLIDNNKQIDFDISYLKSGIYFINTISNNRSSNQSLIIVR